MGAEKRAWYQIFAHASNFTHFSCEPYTCLWLVEHQKPTLEQWWFAVQVAVCGAGVILPNLTRLCQKVIFCEYAIPHHSDGYERMNAAYLMHTRTFDTRLSFPLPHSDSLFLSRIQTIFSSPAFRLSFPLPH